MLQGFTNSMRMHLDEKYFRQFKATKRAPIQWTSCILVSGISYYFILFHICSLFLELALKLMYNTEKKLHCFTKEKKRESKREDFFHFSSILLIFVVPRRQEHCRLSNNLICSWLSCRFSNLEEIRIPGTWNPDTIKIQTVV